MLLRHFSVAGQGKEPQIHVFDKRLGRSFRTALENVVAEREFYDLPHPSGTYSLEPAFAELETHTSPALQALIARRRLDALTEEDLSWLAMFVAAQRLRVRNFRESMKHFNGMIAEKVRRMGGDPLKVKGWDHIQDDEELKVASSVVLLGLLEKLPPMIRNKRWLLFEPPPGEYFWISDNPIVLHHEGEAGQRGELGFAVPGIEIYAPLSPTLLLGMWCPTREQEFREGLGVSERTLQRLDAQGLAPTVGGMIEGAALRDRAVRIRDDLRPICAAISAGTPVQATSTNMMFYNSLQVAWAERYVMSNTADFSLARRMLDEKPHLRDGPRFRLD